MNTVRRRKSQTTCFIAIAAWIFVSFASASVTSHQPPVTSHYGLTDDPRTLPPYCASFSSSPLLPDTLIQRLVNRVSPDSIQARLQRMQDFRTRYSPTESCRAAEQYVFDYFTSLGLDSVSLDSYPGSGGTSAERRRHDSRHPEPGCGAHHLRPHGRHVREPDCPGPRRRRQRLRYRDGHRSCPYPGFRKPRLHDKVHRFHRRGTGAYGSSYYARLMRSRNVNLVGVLNFDMVAWSGGDWGTQITTDSASEPLARVEDEMAATYTNLAHRVNVRGPLGSDQLPFQQQGFPATAAIEYGHVGYPYYHNTGDTLGNLSMPLAAEVAKMSIATLVALTAIPAPTAGFSLADAGTGGACSRSGPRIRTATLPATGCSGALSRAPTPTRLCWAEQRPVLSPGFRTARATTRLFGHSTRSGTSATSRPKTARCRATFHLHPPESRQCPGSR